MKRTLTAVAASLAVLSTAPAAFAQAKGGDFGEQGQFMISADRLFQLFAWDNWTRDDLTGGLGGAANKSTVTDNQIFTSLLYGSSPNQIEPFFTVPRAGFDYVIVPNVTIGGDLVMVFTYGGKHTTEQDYSGTGPCGGSTCTSSSDNPGILGFGVAPRGGYILGLNDMFSLWLRGGVSYYLAQSKTTVQNSNPTETITTTVNQFALDLEPQFVMHMIPHVAFTAGLDVDIPITGGISADDNRGGTSRSVSGGSGIAYIGLDLGLVAYF